MKKKNEIVAKMCVIDWKISKWKKRVLNIRDFLAELPKPILRVIHKLSTFDIESDVGSISFELLCQR